MKLKAELVGGPFDGDTGTLVEVDPPTVLWATMCDCGRSHVIWYGEWVQGAERYTRAEPGAECQRYVFADLGWGPNLTIDERETVPA